MDGGLHDALALTQKWDGRGTFRGERASASSGRVDALLTKYQFQFDDESIDFELIECLLRYICRSAYEDGAVLVFLPGWDDITRYGTKLEFGGTPELGCCPVVRVSVQRKCIRAFYLITRKACLGRVKEVIGNILWLDTIHGLCFRGTLACRVTM